MSRRSSEAGRIIRIGNRFLKAGGEQGGDPLCSPFPFFEGIPVFSIRTYDMTEEFLTEINENLKILQRRDGLAFGTDAYLLAAFVRGDGNAAEFGGGSGVVSLLCASRGKFRRILCAEIQPALADLIGRNAALNGLEGRVVPLLSDVRDLTAGDTGGELSAVFSNPPYFRAGTGKVSDSPEKRAARQEENGTIREFCAAASRLLRWGGTFTVVYRPERMAELFYSLRLAGLEPKRIVLIHPVSDAPPSLLLLEAKKGAGEGLVFSRPLIVYRDPGKTVYTDDMQKVYDDFTLNHLF